MIQEQKQKNKKKKDVSGNGDPVTVSARDTVHLFVDW